MWNKYSLILLTIVLIVLIVLISNTTSKSQVRYSLNEGWRFRKANTNEGWLNASVPGSIHADLYANGVIPNPFSECNHQNLTWVEETTWEYSLDFTFDKSMDNFHKLFLIFDGIDTYAEVYLNGISIFSANNMFRLWKTEITKSHIKGTNNIRVVFRPVSEFIDQQSKNIEFKLPGGEWAHIRKAAFQFGWDFAPRMLTCGIWQPVYIQSELETSLCKGQINIQSADSTQAQLTASFGISSVNNKKVTLKVVNSIDGQPLLTEYVNVSAGENSISIPFSITNPMLWWPNGMGQQYLYNFALVLETENSEHQVIFQQVGIRTIQVVNEPDDMGTSFYLKVNGLPVFAKGANIVPPHSYLPFDKSGWISLAISAKQSNMNMLRVWGGGVYPPNEFYTACDSLGILVWQDFMFACSMYPWNDEFFENVRIEVSQQVERLKKFSSLALWCGNNEVNEGWNNWGWQKELKDSIQVEQVWGGYQKIFHEVIPKVIKDNDSSRFYWPSSPEFGWGAEESMDHGDSHYWGVWLGKEPFGKYRSKIPRFMSEYGFQSLPSIPTQKRFTDSSSIPSPSQILCHQKNTTGDQTIDLYMKREGFTPTSSEQRVFFSQITQAIGYQTAIEAHRLASPKCMGSLFWQLNDCWPSISWSSIDFFGQWKAVQYQSKRSFEPFIIVPEFRGSRIVVRLVSDLPYPVEGDVVVNIYTPSGKKLGVWKDYITLTPNSSVKAIDEKLYDDPAYNMPMIAVAEFIVDIGYSHYGISSNTKWGELELKDPELFYHLKNENEKTFVEIKAKRYAFYVEISNAQGNLKLEDNYFHMIPGKKYLIRVLEGNTENIVVKTLWDYMSKD